MKNQSTKYKMNNSLEYQIRPATIADLDKINWSTQDFKNEYYLKKWQLKLENKLDFYVVVVEDFPIAHVLLDWTKYSDKKIGEISSFVVMEIFRGQGIGTNMMFELENVLKNKGYEISQTGAFKYNIQAINLYQKLGYIITGENLGRELRTLENGNTEIYEGSCLVLQKSLKIK